MRGFAIVELPAYCNDARAFRKAHSRGHSIRGYPKRINQAAALLLQRIDDQVWPTVGTGWFTDEVANSVLMCYCEIYWYIYPLFTNSGHLSELSY